MTYMKRGFEARWNEADCRGHDTNEAEAEAEASCSEAEAEARYSGLEAEALTRT